MKRIGILGAGGVSRISHLPVLSNLPGVAISWICDKNKKRASHLARLFGIKSVVTDIDQAPGVDVILVAIPVGYRQSVMHQIFDRGWHALCEKPFAVRGDEHESYVRSAETNGCQVGVGLVRRYAAPTVMARKIVASGVFGPLCEIWANEGVRFKRTGQESGWYMEDASIVGGGALSETGTHLIDQLFYITGAGGFSVHACSQQKYKGLDFSTHVSASISLPGQGDVMCTINVSWAEDLCNGIFLRFTNCMLKVGLEFEAPLEMMTPDGRCLYSINLDDGAASIIQGFYLEWEDFLSQCISGNQCAISAASARDTTAFIETCYATAGEMP